MCPYDRNGDQVATRTTIPSERIPFINGAPTMWEFLRSRAEATPDALMLVDEHDTAVSYAQALDRAERIAAGLYAQGYGPGAPVSWQLPTRIDTVVLSLALARLGAVQNPIIPLYRRREVESVLRQTGAQLFVIPREFRGFDFEAMARDLQDAGVPITVLIIDEGLPDGDPATLPAAPTDGDAIRWVYTTSGTTSEPKCVLHTDQTLITGGLGFAHGLDLRADDVHSILFPYAHIGGPDSLAMMLGAGIPALLMEVFTVEAALPLLRKNKVTITGGSTAFYTAFLAEQRKTPETPILPDMRVLSGGGAPKPAALFYQVRDEMGIRICHGYGMTECPMIVTCDPRHTDDQLANSEGAPIFGIEIEIRDEDHNPVGDDVPGAVWVRGPMVFKGYLDPIATRDAFDAKGFFFTGDNGFIRPDGNVTLVGRSKDMIIRKGENISPREIEDVLQKHPSITAAAVIGLPDEERGELVCAVLELRAGAPAPSLADVVAYCRDAGLMTQKLPERLEVLAELPRNPTMKILKKDLRARFS